MVAWWIPVILRIITTTLGTGGVKVLSEKKAPTQRRIALYTICLSNCLIVNWYVGNQFTPENRWIFIIGLANGFAVYYQWKAYKAGLAKNAVFTILDDIIAMMLSYSILNEGRFLNKGIISGIGLSFLSIALFHLSRKTLSEKAIQEEKAFFLNLFCYMTIWGILLFSMRYFAVAHVPLWIFLSWWYGGTLVAFVILLIVCQEEAYSFTIREYAQLYIISLAFLGSVGCAYWAYMLAPQNVVQPILMVGETVFPYILGVWWFEERFHGIREWGLILLALIGAIIVGINF